MNHIESGSVGKTTLNLSDEKQPHEIERISTVIAAAA